MAALRSGTGPGVFLRLRGLARGFLLSLISITLTLALMEWMLRCFVDVTDDVEYTHLPGVGCGLRPRQEGRFIRSGGVDNRFRVNDAGWNAPREYSKNNPLGMLRVAVVGDSFVEAMHVNPEQSLSSVLERGLRRQGFDAEVYSFGVSGFGTSQVVHMIRDYVLDYSPDVIVYLFIRNDASDSCRCMDDKHWTQQYALGHQGELQRLPFEPYHLSKGRKLLRRFALVRFLLYQRRGLEHLRDARKWIHAPGGGPPPCEEDCWRVVGLLLQDLDATLRARGIPWLLAWEGDARPEYAAHARGHLERIATIAGLPYDDLSPSFAAAANGKGVTYRIPGDGHWNSEGHRIAGEALVAPVGALLKRHP